MRKVLSIVLALAMVLGCFASVFAAEYTDVKADADFATAVSVLSDLGVVSGYTDGTYRPEQTVTRAEMAALLIKALGLTPSASSTTNFSDVPATHWASGYVAYANSLGIIAGYTDGTFKPSKTVSYDEALTMIVSALGYTADSLEGTTWPTAYIMKAQQLKITKGVELLGSAGANRGDIAELLYNTLTVDLGKTNKDGEFVKNSTDAANPDNMLTRLGAELGAKKVILGTEDSAIELAEYVGKYVQTYTDEDGIVAVVVLSTTLEGKMSSDGKKFADTAFATTVDRSAEVFFVNGAVDKTFTDESKATVLEVALTSGKISAVYSAQKWDGIDDMVTAAFVKDFKAGKTTLDGVKFPLTTDKKAIDESKVIFNGVAGLSEIKEDDVVTGYLVDGTVVRLDVCDKVVTGKITAKTSTKLTVDGTAYAFAKVPAAQLKNTDFTNEFNLYFNYAGDLVFVLPVEATVTEPDYAVVIAANYEVVGDTWTGSGKTETRQVKLLLTTGEEVVYDVAKTPKTAALWFEATTTTAAIFMDNNGKQLVTYTLKDGKLNSVTPVGAPTSKTEILKNSTLDGKYFADSAVAFVIDAKDKYTVVTADKFAGMALKNASYELNTKGQIAVLFTGAAEATADTVKGIYTGTWTETKDGYTVSFFVDGAAIDYTAANNTFTAGVLSTITFDGAKVKSLAPITTGENLTTGGALTGNTYLTTGKVSFGLDAKVIVYIVTKNTDGTVKSVELGALADLESTKNTSVTGYDFSTKADDIYDVVVITR